MTESDYQVYETRNVKIWLGVDGILRVVSVPTAESSLAAAVETLNLVAEASLGVKRPVLGDIREVKGLSKDERSFYSSEEAVQFVSAVALLIGSPVSRVIGNLFLGFNRPPVPTRLFTNQPEAIG